MKWLARVAPRAFALVAVAAGLAVAPDAILAAPFLLPFVSGATTLTTDITEAMKIIFNEPIVNNVVTDTELLNEFNSGGGIQQDITTGGRYIETAQQFGLPAGVGARAEGGYIPIPDGPDIKNARVNLKKILGSTEMSAGTMKMVRTREGAFLNWAERALPQLVQRVTHELDRILLGDGSGVKARVNEATPNTDANLPVDAAFGIAGYDLNDSLIQFLSGESLIFSPNADGSSPRTTIVNVNDVSWDNYLVLSATPTDLVDSDYIFAGDSAGNSAGEEPMGLHGMVDDGGILATFQNIARSSYAAWRSQVFDAQTAPFAAGQTLTEKLLVYADNLTQIRGGGNVDLVVASVQGVQQYWADLEGKRRFTSAPAMSAGMDERGMPIYLGDRALRLRSARKMPGTVAFGLQRSTFKKWMLHEWEWDDTTGSIWRQVTDATGRKDAFWAYGSLYLECGNLDPQKNFRIDNIDDVAF